MNFFYVPLPGMRWTVFIWDPNTLFKIWWLLNYVWFFPPIVLISSWRENTILRLNLAEFSILLGFHFFIIFLCAWKPCLKFFPSLIFSNFCNVMLIFSSPNMNHKCYWIFTFSAILLFGFFPVLPFYFRIFFMPFVPFPWRSCPISYRGCQKVHCFILKNGYYFQKTINSYSC